MINSLTAHEIPDTPEKRDTAKTSITIATDSQKVLDLTTPNREDNSQQLRADTAYIASSGGAWRLLPTVFPPFPTVQKYFCRWRGEGLQVARTGR
ncbi:transposase [Brucella intermedia]|uniref:transposase n=1 Tax=Brucella intermedia TaxID=94625 RepID=UPI003B63CD49